MTRTMIAVAVALMGGVGCGSSGEGTTEQPTAPEVSTVTTSDTTDVATDAALRTVRAQAPSYESVPDEKIVAILEANCAAFDEGQTWAASVEVLTDTGMSGQEAGVLIAASTALCPEHSDKLPN